MKPRRPRKEYVGARIEREVKRKLAQKAQREQRSIGKMIELLLIQGTQTEILE